MKLRHNSHGSWERPSAKVDEAYENEVARSTERGERLYAQAQARLRQAERRLAKAQHQPRTPQHQLADLEAIVELRRAELEKYRRLMVAVAANAEHRGTKSFRPVLFNGPGV